MAYVNRILVETINVVVRAAHLDARANNNGSTSFGSQDIPATTSASAASPTSSDNSATTTAASTGGGGGSQSPLLFFVALGFGVVFTNLWYAQL